MTKTKTQYINKTDTYNFKVLSTGKELNLKCAKVEIREVLEKLDKKNKDEFVCVIDYNTEWLNELVVGKMKKEQTLGDSIKPKEESGEFVSADVVELKNVHEKLRYLQSTFNVKKDNKNKFGNYKYRSCEDIFEAVKPHLLKLNLTLVLTDDVILCGDRIYIKATATLRDTENEKEFIFNSALAREPLKQAGMGDSQMTGTASSYARKYCLSGLFLLDDNTDVDSMEKSK